MLRPERLRVFKLRHHLGKSIMAEIILTPGDLPPPACYPTEQDRFDAYVAAIIATISGGIEWEASQVAPSDLTMYWLRLDSNSRPVEALKWSTADGAWVRWKSETITTGISGGAADAYTLTNTPAMTSPTAMRPGQLYGMFSVAANTGASTLNIDGIGAFPIRLPDDSTPMVQGDIVTGQAMVLMVNQAGNAFLLVSPTSNNSVRGSISYSTPGSGNFTVPGGVFSLEAECVGGGGGGGFSAGCKGGGGGGYAYKRLTVTPGQVIPYVVGAAGTGGTVYGTPNATSGGDTIFNATQIAYGGASGDSGGSGGAYTGADIGWNGQPGTCIIPPDKYLGGKAAFGASYGVIVVDQGTWAVTPPYLGGGGLGDSDSAGGSQATNGSAGCIVIKW